MKFFLLRLLLLPFTAVLATAPVRAPRQNVLSFLNDAFGTTTEEPAKISAQGNPPSPVKEPNSEDSSAATSAESFPIDGFPEPSGPDKNGGESRDASEDLDSHEIMVPFPLGKEPALWRRTARGKGDTQLADVTGRPFQDHAHQKQSQIQGQLQANREKTDQNSEEGMMIEAESWRQSSDLSRQATGVQGMSGGLAPDRSRETPDWDSFEDKDGRLPVMGKITHEDYDETREHISSEFI
ncbi:uncharacterized protein LOC133440961 [Cololabis saira]|uniref:uncharacterized protein LOC133440961 n=1 Tax=Cololabis saira TaxID=129043 RepID=UPI002AD2C22B|nr:uncharacterized protein LOC133440961 [Cololabis saira]